MQSKLLTKICLGTAQFGLNYGINNKTGVITQKEVFDILDEANKKRIKYIDTSNYYGDSEQKIGRYLKIHKNDYKIISKLPDCLETEVKYYLQLSLNKLNVNVLYGYLIHHFEHYKKRPEILDEIMLLKENGLIMKTGFSLYHTYELEFLLNNNIEFDLVQIPFNLLDQRFSKYFQILKEKNIEIHSRSVFLQGLLTMHYSEILKKFTYLKQNLDSLIALSKKLDISIIEMALSFALLNNYIDRVIIGIDNYAQFKEILLMKILMQKQYEEINWDEFANDDENIILPINWDIN